MPQPSPFLCLRLSLGLLATQAAIDLAGPGVAQAQENSLVSGAIASAPETSVPQANSSQADTPSADAPEDSTPANEPAATPGPAAVSLPWASEALATSHPLSPGEPFSEGEAIFPNSLPGSDLASLPRYSTTAAALVSVPTVFPLAQVDPESEASPGLDTNASPSLDDLPLDPELGVVQIRSLLADPDLGILRIRDQPIIAPVAVPRPQFGFLLARMGIASSDNILLAINDVGGLTGDTFIRPSLGLAVYPPLGPQTAFIATADLGLQRYLSQSSLNYDDLRLRVGVRQGLSPRSYGQLVLGYQELFRPGANRDRFFKNTSLGLTLGRRDPLTPSLTLDSYYLAQFNGAQAQSGGIVTDFSRIFQSAGAYLGYDITPQLQTGISYQLNLIDYTSQDRHDTFQQVLGQVAYRISPAVRLSIYGGISFGGSSDPRVDFNDTFFGAAFEATVPLF